MANSASISASIAGRYAQAAFDIVKDAGGIDILSNEVDQLSAALGDSDDLRRMIASPLYSREQELAAIRAIAQKMGLTEIMTNTLALMARNRRLFTLPQFLAELRGLIAAERGEITAEVVSAQALSDEQRDRLVQALSAKSGKIVRLDARVDDSLIGGMIVKLGSQMIDSSIRSKLASLQNAMKEVG